ncbi:MAG: histidinol-phosphate transaminase [Phycisphaerae bacterium]|nr:histidinol-phosphate transaminase [Phycisphaerae bacterium]
MTSYFRKSIAALEGYVPGEQPSDPLVIKLNTNENPYPPSARVMQAIAAIGPDQLRRYPNPLGNLFRDTAARVFGVTRDMVICGNGMDDILNLGVRALSGPDAALVYPTPTYTLYSVLASIQASIVREVAWPEDYSLPIDQLVAARGQVIYLANPNSPTSTFVPVADVARLADAIDGVLCVDEAYADFAYDNCMELAKTRKNVLVMRTMSKGYSLAGLRFGFAVGDRGLIDGLMKVKDSYNVDAVAIAAASAALDDQAYRERTRQKVITERGRLADALAGLGLSSLPSQSNFLLTTARRPPARQLYESLKARRILVRYFNIPGLDDKLRISIGTPEQNDALIAAVKELSA